MADDRQRNQGMKHGIGEGTGQHAPGRNPKDDQWARQPAEPERNAGRGHQGGDFDPSRGGDGGSYKDGGHNEHMRR